MVGTELWDLKSSPLANVFRIRESGAKKCLPKLCFVGLFDTIHDSSVDQSLQWPASIYLYHAASMHEDDNTLKVRLLSEDASKNAYETPKYVEAWFAGSHIDIGGGANQDGLSLYPLQWMLIEAQKKGLCLNKPILPDKKEGQLVEDIVQLVFPSSGKTLDSKSSVIDPWTLRYANNLTIQLYNLRISHQHGNLQQEQDQRPKKNVLIQARKEPGNHRIPANQRHNVKLNKTRPYTQHRYGGSGSIYRAIFASEETDTPSASRNELVGYSHDCKSIKEASEMRIYAQTNVIRCFWGSNTPFSIFSDGYLSSVSEGKRIAQRAFLGPPKIPRNEVA